MTSDGDAAGFHGTLLRLGGRDLETRHGRFRVETFENLHTHRVALALCLGDVRTEAPLLSRVHSSCMTSEAFGGCDCDCLGQLDEALETIAREGRGVVFYLMQEGRGAGFVAKALDRMIVQASGDHVTTFEAYALMGLGNDYRRYDEVAYVRALLGIRAPLRLLSNNPEKLSALVRAEIPIAEALPLERESSPYNVHYLAAKSRSGHRLRDPGPEDRPAALPEEVEYFAPHPVEAHPRFVRMARYLLPIRIREASGPPAWFRLSVYFDRSVGSERIVFEPVAEAGVGGAPALLRIQRESVFERFPLRGGGKRKGSWHASLRALVERGAGCALFVPFDDPGECLVEPASGSAGIPAESGPEADPELLALLAQHLNGGIVQLLVDPSASAGGETLARTLRDLGVDLAVPVALTG